MLLAYQLVAEEAEAELDLTVGVMLADLQVVVVDMQIMQYAKQ
jgi:hypothetical protein